MCLWNTDAPGPQQIYESKWYDLTRNLNAAKIRLCILGELCASCEIATYLLFKYFRSHCYLGESCASYEIATYLVLKHFRSHCYLGKSCASYEVVTYLVLKHFRSHCYRGESCASFELTTYLLLKITQKAVQSWWIMCNWSYEYRLIIWIHTINSVERMCTPSHSHYNSSLLLHLQVIYIKLRRYYDYQSRTYDVTIRTTIAPRDTL